MSVSQGRVHDVFTRVIGDLATQAAAQAASSRGAGRRPWNVPTAAGTAGPLDVPGTTASFDRALLNQNYAEIVGNDVSGTVGDVISVKNQGDYVAIAERGYRARHCTPVRLLAMSAARRRGQGDARGVFLGSVAAFAQDALKAGQS